MKRVENMSDCGNPEQGKIAVFVQSNLIYEAGQDSTRYPRVHAAAGKAKLLEDSSPAAVWCLNARDSDGFRGF